MEQAFEISAVLYGTGEFSDQEIEHAADKAFGGLCIDLFVDRSESHLPRIQIEGIKNICYLPDEDQFDDLEDRATLCERVSMIAEILNDTSVQDNLNIETDVLQIVCDTDDDMYNKLQEEEESELINELEARKVEQMLENIGA